MSDESKINDLFKMNKNDFVTKQQLTDYSKYLINEISSTKKEVKSAITLGQMDPKKLESLLEYYEELNTTNTKVIKYLDYLAEKVQVMVNENKSLKSTTEKLITHNDYLAENLEKAINYSEYLAENLDKNISYSEYIAENLDKNISYSEYLAENLDKNIAYSEYIAENLDKNIAYSEYIAENLDKNISYSEYLAENLDNTIAYSEYLAEHLEGNIAYSEYIAEHLDDNIAYSEYIAENLDKTVSYAGMISEKLNGGKVFENFGEEGFPTLGDAGFEVVDDTKVCLDGDCEEFETEIRDNDGDGDLDMISRIQNNDEIVDEEEIENTEFVNPTEEELSSDNDVFGRNEFVAESDSELSIQINKLIEEAKKRKVSESNDLHFLKFLNKSQVDSFYNLSKDDQEQVKLYISEKSYYTSSEVLRLITESLSVTKESVEEKLIRLMPENIKPIWNQLNESSKKSMLSQARLYPELDTESKVEHFWLTRNLKKNESVNKKLVSHNSLIQEDKLSDKEVTAIMERLKSL